MGWEMAARIFPPRSAVCAPTASALPGRRSEIRTLTIPDLKNQNVPLDKILSRFIYTRVDNSGRCLLLESNHGSEVEHGVQAPSQIH